ncbi:MAG: MarR family transcriptional regulator [ANME-2 cluster archaeon]|nr:MarR family transcriptional regulator [ANME-2 cluster archaeon]
MDELIGFVSGNDKRDKILGILGHHGALDQKLLAKRARMIPQSAAKILDELQDKGLVEENEGTFSLTEIGTEVENKMKSLR